MNGGKSRLQKLDKLRESLKKLLYISISDELNMIYFPLDSSMLDDWPGSLSFFKRGVAEYYY